VTIFSPLNGLLLILLAESVSGSVPWSGSLLIEESAVLKHEKFNKKASKNMLSRKTAMRVETRETGHTNHSKNFQFS